MEVEHLVKNWFPRNILRRTNWLCRTDAFGDHDLREMNMLWEVSSLFLEQYQQFVIWKSVIKSLMGNDVESLYHDHL